MERRAQRQGSDVVRCVRRIRSRKGSGQRREHQAWGWRRMQWRHETDDFRLVVFRVTV